MLKLRLGLPLGCVQTVAFKFFDICPLVVFCNTGHRLIRTAGNKITLLLIDLARSSVFSLINNIFKALNYVFYTGGRF